jgi:general secretion pathway protein E
LEQISRQFAIDHGLLSQGSDVHGERLAITSTTSPIVIWNIATRLRCQVSTQIVDQEELHRAIDEAYSRHQSAEISPTASTDEKVEELEALPHELPEEDLAKLLADANQDLLTTDGKSPLVRFLDRLLFTAVTLGASDLHLQPTPDHLLVRMRIDGVLDQGRRIPLSTVRPLVSRIKVIGRMDVAERLLPQDGRTTLTLAGRSIDVRISTVPTAYGERVVMRLLDANRQLLTTESLGMPPQLAAQFVAASTRSSGIILVTGPTGSGKTTTLYATLRCLDAIERNIMTIEDPIEYELSSLGIPISQSQVNLRKGVSFANGLRHLLRQDPDVIMVGEIRDTETARIAIQASLTGHLVFSTLHTNDAPSAVTRLIDLGVEPYLVAASLSTVLAQRLVRTCCSACSGTGMDVHGITCEVCVGSGFKGRSAIFEMLPVDEIVRSVLTNGGSLLELRNAARAAGMRTLAEAGADLVATGRTTAAEVERVIHHG